jgi:membrane protease YdiL (CAAX protease family)
MPDCLNQNESKRDIWINSLAFCYFLIMLGSFLVLPVIAEILKARYPLIINGLPEEIKFLATIVIMQLIPLILIIVSLFTLDNQESWLEKLKLQKWRMYYPVIAVIGEIIIMPTIIIVVLAFQFILQTFKIPFEMPALNEIALTCSDNTFIMLAFSAVILAPVIEEIMFRRVLFSFLSCRIGVISGFIATSFIFAAVHGSILQLPGLFMLAALLQLIYLKCNSLYPGIFLHCLHNSVAIAVLFLMRLIHLHFYPLI